MNLLQAYHRNTWNLTAVKELLIIFIQVNFNKADTISLVASNRSAWSPLVCYSSVTFNFQYPPLCFFKFHFVQLTVSLHFKSYKNVHCLQLGRARWGKQWLHTYLTEEVNLLKQRKMRFTSIHVLIRVRTDFWSKIQDFFQNNNSFFQTQGYQIGGQQRP